MVYPINILRQELNVFPLFGNQLSSNPFIFDLSRTNPKTLTIDTLNFSSFQKSITEELLEKGYSWGIGRYLEERSNLLRNYYQILKEGRTYHVGIDIIVPQGFSLYAPIQGTVYKAGIEEGIGNYGGYVIIKHEIGNEYFYSFYGHLNRNHVVSKGQILSSGQVFGEIGGEKDSGGWFTHTHLQIITEKAEKLGRMFHGYVSKDDLPNIESLFPNPYLLFRY